MTFTRNRFKEYVDVRFVIVYDLSKYVWNKEAKTNVRKDSK